VVVTGRARRRWPAALLVVALLAVAAACSGAEPGSEGGSGPTTTAPDPGGADFSGPGPYAVGRTTLTLADRGDRPVLVLYPAAGEATGSTDPVPGVDGEPPSAAGDGPFPVVLYSHGLGGTAGIAVRQLQHLASWGFVVASPEHLERNLFAVASGRVDVEDRQDVGDLRAVLGALAAETADADSPLEGAVDLGHVAGLGHSAGGRAVAWLAQEGELDAWVGQAPAPPVPFTLADLGEDRSSPATLDRMRAALADQEAPDVPALLVAADDDVAIPTEMVDATYDWLAGPRRLVTLARTGHNSFTDACASLRAAAGAASALAGRIDEANPDPDPDPDSADGSDDVVAGLLELGSDGCTADDADPDDVRTVLGHLHVAHLRAAFFGTPGDVASLDPAFVDRLFPEAVASTRADG
jgi:predicted dienelactone hydrolase